MSLDPTQLPKKKKKSFFEDDDFFVMSKAKKSRSHPPRTSLSDKMKTNTEINDGKHEMQTFDKKDTEIVPETINKDILLPMDSALHPIVSGSSTSEDDQQAFESADDVTSGPLDFEMAASIRSSPRGKTNTANSKRLRSSGDVDNVALYNNDIALGKGKFVEKDSIVLDDHINDMDNIDLDDDPDLKEFFSHLSSGSKQDELSRLYQVKIISKVRPFHTVEKEITGDVTFEQLLNLIRFEIVKRGDIVLHQSALVWVEGKSELKKYFKPSTLRISAPSDGSITKITCLYIPAEHLHDFETIYKEHFLDPVSTDESTSPDESIIEIRDDSDSDFVSVPTNDGKTREYFVIGLKGKDNKRIDVEVNSETPIRKLLEYYLSEKGIEPAHAKNARLVFDSDELSLEDTVGDTELEEDFEIEVYV